MRMKKPPHPGRIVRQECIESLGLTITDAAKRLGVTRQALNNVVNEKAGISPEMAIRCPKAFGSSPEVWLGLQMEYDLAQAEKESSHIKVRKNCVKTPRGALEMPEEAKNSGGFANRRLTLRSTSTQAGPNNWAPPYRRSLDGNMAATAHRGDGRSRSQNFPIHSGGSDSISGREEDQPCRGSDNNDRTGRQFCPIITRAGNTTAKP